MVVWVIGGVENGACVVGVVLGLLLGLGWGRVRELEAGSGGAVLEAETGLVDGLEHLHLLLAAMDYQPPARHFRKHERLRNLPATTSKIRTPTHWKKKRDCDEVMRFRSPNPNPSFSNSNYAVIESRCLFLSVMTVSNSQTPPS